MYGEHGGQADRPRPARGSSPHVRGAPRRRVTRGPPPRIIPACTGSTCTPTAPSAFARDHPRMYGEHRLERDPEKFRLGSSPHVRGAPPSCAPRGPRARDHPRMYGEHASRFACPFALWGSSPHVRGAPRSSPSARKSARDHPRMYGEHIVNYLLAKSLMGSSPHVRGAPEEVPQAQPGRGIIPACTGSTPWKAAFERLAWDHPRMYGEHRDGTGVPSCRSGSSPHVRGARCSDLLG